MCGAGDERFSNPADPQWQRNFRHEHMQCVKLLIAHGADPNAVDNWGRNALQLAVESGVTSVIKTLVPKFPRLPAEIVPLIVQFWAHVGDY